MASNTQSSMKNNISLDEKQKERTKLDDRSRGSTSLHLNISPAELKVFDKTRRFNAYDVCVSPSPMDTGPRLFRAGMLFNSKTFEQAFSATYKSPNRMEHIEDEDEVEVDDDGTIEEQQRDLEDTLFEARKDEIQELAQTSVTQRPVGDAFAELILNELDLRAANADPIRNMDVDDNDDDAAANREPDPTSPVISTQLSYPPVNQTGPILDHDRPFAEYGQLDRETIAQQCNFNIQSFPNVPPPNRYHAKSFAIISSTNVDKQDIIANIQAQFNINKIQYICIGEDINEFSQQPNLHIQIVFKNRIDRRKPFIDEVTRTRCNYEVTDNDLAWNEYIKKGGHFIEFGEFKSIQKQSQRQWPSSSISSAIGPTTTAAVALPSQPLTQQQPLVLPRTTTTTTTTARPTTVRAQAEEKRKREDEIARHALLLAEKSVEEAMDFTKGVMPNKFMHHARWYEDAFKYVNLRVQHIANRRGVIDKEYIWPDSFPECTPELRATIDQWIRHHFYRVKRAKCLILIGPTGTGKTSFALSLPGLVNYFQGRWNFDCWSDYARYSVYDDVPWDKFEENGFPPKKSMLTQNGSVQVTGKYRGTKEIHIRQPAIVLLNPEDTGSLLGRSMSNEAQQLTDYWQKRATIYVMGPNEYFYTRPNRGQNSSSTASSMSINDNRLGALDEFEEMAQRHREQSHNQ